MRRKSTRRGGFNTHSKTSKSRPVGKKMPAHRISQILAMEDESERVIFPDLSEEERSRHSEMRKNALESMRFPRGTNDWSRILSLVGAYHASIH